MPRQATINVDSDFRGGLITDATGLNFPQNACTDTDNCEFNMDGSVTRRLGLDFETNYETSVGNRANSALNTYLWRNVAGDGSITFVVVQDGATLSFYNTTSSVSFSAGRNGSVITLTPATVGKNVAEIEAQFSDGNGFLFVTHPYINPVRIAYDKNTDSFTDTEIVIKIRDFEGSTVDPYTTTERPTTTLGSLNVDHNYNLRNQGWTTSSLTNWDLEQETMPSNADVMWLFKNANDDFDFTNTSLNRITLGNSPAPKGHFVLALANQDRAGTTGLVGVPSTTTGDQRPSTSAFFAGRVFYSGINYTGFNSKIYFTQIVERPEQYEFCYQTNDPTAQDFFDLLPSDGGVISIPDAGTIIKLFTIPGGIAVFAANGIWYVTGSSGLGFLANDYTVQKISNVTTLGASSFVNVQGFPAWWNGEGIYVMQAQGGIPTVQSISDYKIKQFYDTIPLASKKYAKGIYHYLDKHIRWIYRSSATDQLTEQYEYDKVLNYNTLTNAFFGWTFATGTPKVNSIILSDIVSSAITQQDVVTDTPDLVVDGAADQVIAFIVAGPESSPFDKYLVSYFDGTDYRFTFADKIDADYKDWFSYDSVGVNYTSYFITGYKLTGKAITKLQNNWVRIFSRMTNRFTDSISYKFQSIWDYSLSAANTNRWSTNQTVTHTNTNYSTQSARLKVRGHGLAMQFRVSSVDGKPFDVAGWSALQSVNAIP